MARRFPSDQGPNESARPAGSLAAAGSGASLLGSSGAMAGLGPLGIGLAVVGAVQSSIGAYYDTIAQRYAMRSQALDLEFQGSIADINARAAEIDAAIAIEAGRSDKGRLTLRYGQAKAQSAASQAAAGVQAGVGSAGEIQTSIEAAKELDALTIERNSVRAAGAARTRAVDFRNRGALARVSARNVSDAASSLSPFSAAFSSLIGSAGRVSSNFLAGVG